MEEYLNEENSSNEDITVLMKDYEKNKKNIKLIRKLQNSKKHESCLKEQIK